MYRKRFTSAIALISLTLTFAFGQKVRTDYDHSANFSQYKTFMWIKQPMTPNDPFIKDRIIESVNAQLMAKGLRLVDSNADLGVAVNVATQEKQTLNTFYDGFGPWGWGFGPMATIETYTEGTIIVDLFDAKTKNIVWRGVGTKEISTKPEKESKFAEKAVAKMFE